MGLAIVLQRFRQLALSLKHTAYIVQQGPLLHSPHPPYLLQGQATMLQRKLPIRQMRVHEAKLAMQHPHISLPRQHLVRRALIKPRRQPIILPLIKMRAQRKLHQPKWLRRHQRRQIQMPQAGQIHPPLRTPSKTPRRLRQCRLGTNRIWLAPYLHLHIPYIRLRLLLYPNILDLILDA